MKKWYQQVYINRRNWILDNVNALKLTPQEALVVLLIDLLQENRNPITPEIISNKLGLSSTEIDNILSSLSQKGYLNIVVSSRKIDYQIDGVFKEEVIVPDQLSIIKIFEDVLRRTLSQKEIDTLITWKKDYSDQTIQDALAKATLKNKISFSYIEKILNNNEDK